MIDDRYPELFRLFGAWFNEDWDFQHGTVEAAIEDYKNDSSPEDRQAAISEIDQLLQEKKAENWSKKQFWDFLCFKLGCRYVPPDENTTADEWLLWIRRKLQASMEQSTP